jgi:hypothetical protein
VIEHRGQQDLERGFIALLGCLNERQGS